MIANKITYIVSVALLLVTFVFTANAAALAAAAALIAMPVITVVACRSSVALLKLSFELPRSCVVNAPLVLRITLDRPLMFRGRMELSFSVYNQLTGTRTVRSVSLALEDADFYGLFTVYPEILDIQVDPHQSASAGLEGTSYDPHRSGQDASEVFDVRPYHEGDAVKSIHWKLSTRFDDLLVREASRPQDHAIAILFGAFARDFEHSSRPEVLSAVLSLTASISLALTRQGYHHVVVAAPEGSLAVCPVDDRRGFNKMLDTLTATPLGPTYSALDEQYAKLVAAKGISKTVLVAVSVDEQAFIEMGRLTDLSVFHVSDSVESFGIERGANYTITHCPVSSDSARIKSLEL